MTCCDVMLYYVLFYYIVFYFLLIIFDGLLFRLCSNKKTAREKNPFVCCLCTLDVRVCLLVCFLAYLQLGWDSTSFVKAVLAINGCLLLFTGSVGGDNSQQQQSNNNNSWSKNLHLA